jgi:hypothetical protein
MELQLPDFFLADLPDGVELSVSMMDQACDRLKENADQYLKNRTTSQLVHSLCQLAENWLDPEFPFRQKLIEEGPAQSGFSLDVLMDGMDRMFQQWKPDNFEFWLVQEFGHAERIDYLASNRLEARENKSSRARGPRLITHICSGNLPVPCIMSMVCGMIVRSAQFIKCASGASYIPRLFAHSLYQHDPKMAACIELAEWKGGLEPIENILFEKSDVVTATGSDKSIEAIQSRVPRQKKFLNYGQRLSFGFISKKALSGLGLRRLIEDAARDVMIWDQQGCLSPHVYYVQHKGVIPAEKFAELLAEELERYRLSFPRSPLSVEESAAIRSRRHFYHVRAATSKDTLPFFSNDGTDWSVVYEDEIRFQISCGNRFIYVKGVHSLDEALHGAEPIQHKVSTVALGAADDEAEEFALQIAQWGAPRICPIGKMQHPPLHWRHDGKPALAELVQWTDWEL